MSYVQAEIKCSGVVQGVGYRYYCHRKAAALGLTGWVKNCFDGSVFLVAEGTEAEIEILIKELLVGPPASKVTNIETKWKEYSGNFKNFEIKLY